MQYDCGVNFSRVRQTNCHLVNPKKKCLLHQYQLRTLVSPGTKRRLTKNFIRYVVHSTRPSKTSPDAAHSFFNSPESLPSPPLVPTPYTQKLEQNIHQRFAAVADHFNNPSDSEMDFEVNTCPRLPDNSTQCHIGVHSTEVSAANNVPVLQSQTALNDTLLLSPSVPPGIFVSHYFSHTIPHISWTVYL